MPLRKKRGMAGDKTICLPIEEGIEYDLLVQNSDGYRGYLDKMVRKYPEIFPEEIEKGYKLQGLVTSKRQKLTTRRIRLKANKEAYQIRPDFVMPYMSERVELAEKALYLKSKGLSYEGIAHVLGKSEKHWYNVCQSLGRISLVGSTAKREENLPKHLVADEKHSECQGKKSISP
jgi:hypothetical protein